ncbi:MAG: crotonase/enoyl-CoA hydratase family protein [Actinobacteria bacterium]|nr:MAG: crotonase/enoyl-CoA hydratase family protein [Actinomycetota bacterium]REK39522.1 MAG: crotonase/enoyl-CoA hydratase family protein [Actinomycetota bacterium]
MGAYEHIEVERSGRTATIWLNRPKKLNAMSADMWTDIPRAMSEIEADDSIRVVVLAGRGDAFTVGIDVEMLASFAPDGSSSPAQSNRQMYDTIKRMQRTASVFAESRKPVIAAVHGYCLGAGMDLITACDIRLCASGSVFSIRETRMSLVADIGTLQRLPGIVGAGHVAELAFTGKDIDADRAAEIGLVNHVLPDFGDLMKATDELANEIAANSPLAVGGVKNVLAANSGRSVEDALDYVAQWNAAYLMSSDLHEAISAFMEKRTPEFKGE